MCRHLGSLFASLSGSMWERSILKEDETDHTTINSAASDHFRRRMGRNGSDFDGTHELVKTNELTWGRMMRVCVAIDQYLITSREIARSSSAKFSACSDGVDGLGMAPARRATKSFLNKRTKRVESQSWIDQTESFAARARGGDERNASGVGWRWGGVQNHEKKNTCFPNRKKYEI